MFHGSIDYLDSHWVDCTAITKQLKFYAETSLARGLLHFAGKVTSSSPENWGKYSAADIGQITIHPFIIETLKCSRDGCVINNLL